MKRTLLLPLALAFFTGAFAQLSFDIDVVEASEVPDAVITEHESRYADYNVRRWESHTTTLGDHSGTWYVAIFSIDLRTTRSRYKEDGTAVSATTYYLAYGLPQELKDHAEANYSDYSLNSGEKITIFDTDKTYWRSRLRKGWANKLVYYMEDGVWEEIEDGDILKTLREDENVETE